MLVPLTPMRLIIIIIIVVVAVGFRIRVAHLAGESVSGGVVEGIDGIPALIRSVYRRRV